MLHQFITSKKNQLIIEIDRSGNLDQNKQGLQQVHDKNSVNYQIQYEIADSAKQQMLKRKTQKQQQSIQKILNDKKQINKQQYQFTLKQIDQQIQQQIETFIKQPVKCIVVFDFDCFFCQCEQLLNPQLASVPFIVVGGGIICASNYKARAYGIRSAMPTQVAKELCNELVVKTSNYKYYDEISQKAGKIFKEYDQNLKQLSIDEYRLDLTQYLNNLNSKRLNLQEDDFTNYLCIQNDQNSINASYIVNQIRQRIFSEIGITVTAGISWNTQIAKMVCDFKKPNGQTVTKLCFQDYQDYLQWFDKTIFNQPIRKIWGIGASSEYTLKESLNIQQIGDIYRQRAYIIILFTKSVHSLIYASIGFQNLFDDGDFIQKTRGFERTFQDTGDISLILQITKAICIKLSQQLMDNNQEAKRLQVKLRFSDWSDIQHISDLNFQTNNFDQLYFTSQKIVQDLINIKKQKANGQTVKIGFTQNNQEVPTWFVRLVGIRACELINLDTEDKNYLDSDISEDEQQQQQFQQKQLFTKNVKQQKQNSKIQQQIQDMQKCQYCGLKFPKINIELHEQHCTKNEYYQYQLKLQKRQKKGTIDNFLFKQKQKKTRQ